MFSDIFWIRGEGSVYFNIRGEESVIQASLRGGKCNLFFLLFKDLIISFIFWDSYSNILIRRQVIDVIRKFFFFLRGCDTKVF